MSRIYSSAVGNVLLAVCLMKPISRMDEGLLYLLHRLHRRGKCLPKKQVLDQFRDMMTLRLIFSNGLEALLSIGIEEL